MKMPIWVLFGSFILWGIRDAGFIWRVLKQSLKIPYINKIPRLTYFFLFSLHFLAKMVLHYHPQKESALNRLIWLHSFWGNKSYLNHRNALLQNTYHHTSVWDSYNTLKVPIYSIYTIYRKIGYNWFYSS